MHEIFLPDAKPALEWVNNRVLQKVSPQRRHALAQGQFLVALAGWIREHRNGMVGAEWRFQIQPPGEISRTLVPDVAFLSYHRMPIEELETTEVARIAPDAVALVLSPGDRRRDIEEKVRVYLAAGTDVVFIVDPDLKLVSVRDTQGVRVLREDDEVQHASLPGFSMPVRSLFELLRPRPKATPV